MGTFSLNDSDPHNWPSFQRFPAEDVGGGSRPLCHICGYAATLFRQELVTWDGQVVQADYQVSCVVCGACGPFKSDPAVAETAWRDCFARRDALRRAVGLAFALGTVAGLAFGSLVAAAR